MDEKLALLALHFVPGLGDHLIRQLISYCGSAEQVFNYPKGKLLRVPGIGRVTAEAIKKTAAIKLAEQELTKIKSIGAQLIFYSDSHYPTRLKQINDAPTLLYHSGPVAPEGPRVIGIVGTRRATEYGRQCVEQFLSDLAPFQPLIVSGLAYGIDIHAHRTSLQLGLHTLAVMGTGIDQVYPSQHAPVVKELKKSGALLTELPIGTAPEMHHFPARNRIIAGLCDAIVVVEAASKGGALITADLANDYNREVFAFPGNITQPFSSGCNELIRQNKSHLITKGLDLIEILNWDQKPGTEVKKEIVFTNESEERVVNSITSRMGMATLDEISWQTGFPVSKLLPVLFELEMRGILKSLPGKQYQISGSIG